MLKKPKKLYINGRFLTQEFTGVQWFALGIVEELKTNVDFEILVPDAPLTLPKWENKVTIVKGLQGTLWEQVSLPFFLAKKTDEYALLNLCNTAPFFGKHNWVTIHDLAFLQSNDWFNPFFKKYYSFLIPKLCVKAKRIFTVSETIKQEIIDWVNPETEIAVLYNRVNNSFLETESKTVKKIPEAYFLAVGSINPRKNYEWLTNFFATESKVKLVLLGKAGGNFKDVLVNTTNTQVMDGASIAELKYLYQNALGLIQFSKYEGFGIPLIEAMSQNTPIICSDIQIHHEIAGDEVAYVKLDDESGLKKTIQMLSSRKNVTYTNWERFQNQDRASIIQKGL